MGSHSVVVMDSMLLQVVTLVAGTCPSLMWLGEQVKREGDLVMVFHSNLSLVMFAVCPSALGVHFESAARQGDIILLALLLIGNKWLLRLLRSLFSSSVFSVALQLITLRVNKVKKCLLHRRVICLLKVNMAGVIPPIFAFKYPFCFLLRSAVGLVRVDGMEMVANVLFGTGSGKTALCDVVCDSNCFLLLFL